MEYLTVILGREIKARKASIVDLVLQFHRGEIGMAQLIGMSLLTGLIGIVVTIIILANAIPVLWPMATDASANVTAMTGTDEGTQIIVAFWPIALLVIGIGLAVGVVIFGLKKFGLMGG